VVVINPSQRDISYNIALGDIKAFVDEKRERDWHDGNILDAIIAIGREGIKQINLAIEDMADRLQTEIPELGTEDDFLFGSGLPHCTDATCDPGNCSCLEDS
jgi:hypothetical protein